MDVIHVMLDVGYGLLFVWLLLAVMLGSVIQLVWGMRVFWFFQVSISAPIQSRPHELNIWTRAVRKAERPNSERSCLLYPVAQRVAPLFPLFFCGGRGPEKEADPFLPMATEFQ